MRTIPRALDLACDATLRGMQRRGARAKRASPVHGNRLHGRFVGDHTSSNRAVSTGALRRYDVSVALVGEATRSCHFVISNDPGSCALGHCVPEEDCSALYYVGHPVPERVLILYPVIEAPVDLQVKRDGALLAHIVVEPAYQESRPNGPGCDPICRGASVDVSVPVTPNTAAPTPRDGNK